MMALLIMLVHRVARIASALAVIFVTLAATNTIESQLFFWPDRSRFETFDGAEDVAIPSTDGMVLHGWFLPAQSSEGSNEALLDASERAPSVLFAHGNAGNIAIHYWFGRFLQDAGFNVLVFDYRSFGRSTRATGPLLREDLYEDTNAALDYLLTRPEVDPARVGIYGHSLGAVLALAVAADRPEVRAVAEVSGFSSWKGIAGHRGRWWGPLLIRSGLDAVDSVRRLGDRPLLILHGTRDTTVPIDNAYRIERAAKDAGVRVEMHEIIDAFHHNIFLTDQPTDELLIAFFTRELAPTEASGENDPTDP